MPWFRTPPTDPASCSPCGLDDVRRLIAQVLDRDHFFAAPGLTLSLHKAHDETIPWEVFRGRLLDAAQTRLHKSFVAWDLHADGEHFGGPILSVKLDPAAGEVHVTRALLCHVWEAYDAGGNVILSREVRKWVRELVGTIVLDQLPNAVELRDELMGLIFQAIVGTSRLPLTSVESPLPAFVFGQLAYFFHDGPAPATPMTTCQDVIRREPAAGLSWRERTKWLEFLLRSARFEELAMLACEM